MEYFVIKPNNKILTDEQLARWRERCGPGPYEGTYAVIVRLIDEAEKHRRTIRQLAASLEHVKHFSSIPRKWHDQNKAFDRQIHEARTEADEPAFRLKTSAKCDTKS